ncbi:DUF922 domain-containing protein [Novosphingobium flavum]|uniref:DUF922 domain-containing protein n=1 Tax=Novosphingobium TaxID=165696 RepID=UPI001639E954|nr:DUF922 domain-containing protein [Novosphingobium sp.]MBC2661621.1 DUF922 domain-containing protein [Novosphingobium aerophilum]
MAGRAALPPEQDDRITFVYYDVAGRDAATIRAAMDRLRPIDPADGQPYDALTSWRIDWRWDGNGRGQCDLGTTRVIFSATITFPRLDPAGVPPTVLAEWNRFVRGLREHELQHVRHAMERLPEIDRAVRTATCETANARGEAVLERIRARDRAFDAETRHGLASGVRFPG